MTGYLGRVRLMFLLLFSPTVVAYRFSRGNKEHAWAVYLMSCNHDSCLQAVASAAKSKVTLK